MANKYFKLIVFLIVFFLGVNNVFAIGGTVPIPCDPCLPNPIDGGILGLFAVAIGYGLNRIYKKSKE